MRAFVLLLLAPALGGKCTSTVLCSVKLPSFSVRRLHVPCHNYLSLLVAVVLFISARGVTNKSSLQETSVIAVFICWLTGDELLFLRQWEDSMN